MQGLGDRERRTECKGWVTERSGQNARVGGQIELERRQGLGDRERRTEGKGWVTERGGQTARVG